MFDCGLDPLNLEVGANCSTVILKIVFLDKSGPAKARPGGPLATALPPVYTCRHMRAEAHTLQTVSLIHPSMKVTDL